MPADNAFFEPYYPLKTEIEILSSSESPKNKWKEALNTILTSSQIFENKNGAYNETILQLLRLITPSPLLGNGARIKGAKRDELFEKIICVKNLSDKALARMSDLVFFNSLSNSQKSKVLKIFTSKHNELDNQSLTNLGFLLLQAKTSRDMDKEILGILEKNSQCAAAQQSLSQIAAFPGSKSWMRDRALDILIRHNNLAPGVVSTLINSFNYELKSDERRGKILEIISKAEWVNSNSLNRLLSSPNLKKEHRVEIERLIARQNETPNQGQIVRVK